MSRLVIGIIPWRYTAVLQALSNWSSRAAWRSRDDSRWRFDVARCLLSRNIINPSVTAARLHYAVAEWYGAGLAIARSWVWLPRVAAVYQRQLSVPSLRGRLMSSSLRVTGWRPSAADWGGSMSVVPRRGTTSSCQSAATSKIVKRCRSRVYSCKQRCIKYPDLYLYYTSETAGAQQG